MEDDNGVAAEVIEVIGVTGMHGEAMQIKCRILEGNNKGRCTHLRVGIKVCFQWPTRIRCWGRRRSLSWRGGWC